MGRSMPVTPREGMAAATIIIMAMVTSSPHCRPHCRLGRASTNVDGDQQKKKQAVRRRGRRGKAHGRALDQHGGMGHAEGDGNAQQSAEKQAAESDVGVGAFSGSGRSEFGETGSQTGGDFSFQAGCLARFQVRLNFLPRDLLFCGCGHQRIHDAVKLLWNPRFLRKRPHKLSRFLADFLANCIVVCKELRAHESHRRSHRAPFYPTVSGGRRPTRTGAAYRPGSSPSSARV